MVPSFAPPWSKLFSRDQDFNIAFLSKLFNFVVAMAFKSFILELDMVTSIFLNIFVQDCS